MGAVKRWWMACLVLCLMTTGAHAAPSTGDDEPSETTITFEVVTRLFDKMQAMNWDADHELAWGYFFADHSSEKLFNAAALLEKQGYRLAGILAPRPEEPDQDRLFLRVEKIERHTPQSLYERNAQLRRWAKEMGLDAYDGMNVGQVKK